MDTAFVQGGATGLLATFPKTSQASPVPVLWHAHHKAMCVPPTMRGDGPERQMGVASAVTRKPSETTAQPSASLMPQEARGGQ
jgi:hypothetical protein